MELKRSSKYLIAGVILIILGVVLNQLAIWVYNWSFMPEPGEIPPPVAVIAGTIFLALIPIGLILVLYGLYLRWMESQQPAG
ncbi:hypothetical protein EU538_07435 [Candidatus Thorarchaeota archaeon]|jgi:uncharacterized membrane protein|nr:MAG: hypothetical protein EU538_07435 [Candidatus Thorarchaeota archaeon]